MTSFSLSELDAGFVIGTEDDGLTLVDRMQDAQGVMFLCPKCFEENDGPVGTHRVICWFADRGVPDDRKPGPGRWIPGGSGIDDLTFVGPAAASVGLSGGCLWHGFIRDGRGIV